MFIARSASRRRSVTIALLCVSALVLVGGTAEAARRYEANRSDRLLPGITVGGVDVGGRTIEQATDLVRAAWVDPLDAPVTIEAGGHTDVVTLRDLGASTDAVEQLDRALDLTGDLPFLTRLFHRITGRPLARSFEVHRTVDADGVASYVDEIASRVDLEPVDSRVDVSSGFVELTPHRTGLRVAKEAAVERILGVLSGDATAPPGLPDEPMDAPPSRLELPSEVLEPEKRISEHGTILLIRTGENRLYHYEGDRLLKWYPVATGQPEYPTPAGSFHITLKRRNPTWVNPAKSPGDWGYSLPARIGPGPDNPLGTRALNLSVSGIRIHGTSNTGSIGYNASHGCIRMLRADVEELFERVDVGAPVYVVRAGGPKIRGSGSSTIRAEGA